MVPTMGALHRGHLSLVHASVEENDITVVTIFVNPIQFNNPEDLLNYPKTLDKDLQLLSQTDDVVAFVPSTEEIYPVKPFLKFHFGHLEYDMEGEFRSGHFNGVAMVVAKLLNIVNPDKAYFGQKDLQQFAVIRQLVDDLSFPVELKCMPIIRESDGLALSSRNRRLSPAERQVAPIFHQALKLSSVLIAEDAEIRVIDQKVQDLFESSEAQLEYFKIVDPISMEPVESISEKTKVALCIAGYVGEIRLIDNLIVENEH